MRDDAIRQRLRDRNPWWRTVAGDDPVAWTAVDQTLRDAERYEIGYRPPILDDVEPDGLYILRGPRRVGKSVALKRLAASLLERGVEPLRVIHLPLSDLSAQDLRRALSLGRSMTASMGDRPRYWLLDEVTAVPDWTKVLKDARDETPLRADAVVLTGSSAHDLAAAERDLGAGRSGSAIDRLRLLLPMSFREVLSVRRPDIPLPGIVTPDALQSPAIAGVVAAMDPWLGELDFAWQEYLESGGFPRAVAEHLRTGAVSTSFCMDLRAWLTADITADDPPESVLALLGEVGARMTSPLDVTALAAALGTTRHVAQLRVNRLRSSVAAVACSRVDDRGVSLPRGRIKLYPVDPLLVSLPGMLEPGLGVPDMTRRSEAAIGVALARTVDRRHPGRLLDGRAIGYSRTGGGREIDFAPLPIRVGGAQTSTVPLESKWVSGAWRRDALVLENGHGRGVLATKDILDTSHPVWAVPAPLLALLLG